MANPNMTFANWRNRKWSMIERVEATSRMDADDKVNELVKKYPKPTYAVRARSFKIGPRNNPVKKWYVAVYSKPS